MSKKYKPKAIKNPNKKFKYDDINKYIKDLNHKPRNTIQTETIKIVQLSGIVECPPELAKAERASLTDSLDNLTLVDDFVVFETDELSGFAFRFVIKEEDAPSILIILGTFFDLNPDSSLREMELTSGIAKQTTQEV